MFGEGEGTASLHYLTQLYLLLIWIILTKVGVVTDLSVHSVQAGRAVVQLLEVVGEQDMFGMGDIVRYSSAEFRVR